MLSGAAEPAAAALTILPYEFFDRAMMYVVAEELIPEINEGEHGSTGMVTFVLGFTLMMALSAAPG